MFQSYPIASSKTYNNCEPEESIRGIREEGQRIYSMPSIFLCSVLSHEALIPFHASELQGTLECQGKHSGICLSEVVGVYSEVVAIVPLLAVEECMPQSHREVLKRSDTCIEISILGDFH
jgi:hypothetical protein